MASESRRADPSRRTSSSSTRGSGSSSSRRCACWSGCTRSAGRSAATCALARKSSGSAAHISLTFPPSAIHDLSAARTAEGPAVDGGRLHGADRPLGRAAPALHGDGARGGARAASDGARRDSSTSSITGWSRCSIARGRSIAFRSLTSRRAGRGRRRTRSPNRCTPTSAWRRRGSRGRQRVEDHGFVFYAGLLAQQPRSASALEGMLADYFARADEVGQFAGQWLPLVEENRSRVGRAGRPGEDDRALTMSGTHRGPRQAVLGPAGRVPAAPGPHGLCRVPGAPAPGLRFRVLVQMTRFFVSQGLDFDVQLVLKGEDVPVCRLGDRGPGAPASAGPPGSGEACAREMSMTPSWATAGLVARYPIVNP